MLYTNAWAMKMKTIEGYSNYLLTEDGKVFSKHRNGFLEGSINPAGYCNFRLTGDDGYTFTWGRHRLMCFVFKHPGKDISELVVNHKNGIKGDDFLDNLEWVTQKENVIHAGENGLSEKCIPVSARIVDTGEILNFVSYHECGLYFGLSKDAITYRVKLGESRVFPERVQYRKRSDSSWYIPENIEKALLLNSTRKSVEVRYLKTNEVKTFDKLSELANSLNISAATISCWINKSGQPVLPGMIQLRWGHENVPWRNVGDLYDELAQSMGIRPVVIINDLTRDFHIFEKPIDCASSMFLKPTNLNHRLKTKGNTVYPDGYRYMYYSDFKNSPFMK